MLCCGPSAIIESTTTSAVRSAATSFASKSVQTLDVGNAADMNDKGGRAPRMEDEFVALPNYKDDQSFFAVYDGHGGSTVATYCKENLHNVFFSKYQSVMGEEEIIKAWEETYQQVDIDMQESFADSIDADCAGSTATTVFVAPEHEDGWMVSIANVGDSKAMLYSMGQCKFVSETHRPSNDDEAARIKLAGGWLAGEKARRLNGRLSVTRALGDHYIKKTTKGLIVTPSVTTVHVKPSSILVLASDGLWDFATEEAQQFMYTEDVDNMPAQQVAKWLLELAQKRHSNDNIAIVVIHFTTKRITSGLAGKFKSSRGISQSQG